MDFRQAQKEAYLEARRSALMAVPHLQPNILRQHIDMQKFDFDRPSSIEMLKAKVAQERENLAAQ